jgi:hypothetical protein
LLGMSTIAILEPFALYPVYINLRTSHRILSLSSIFGMNN